MIKNNTQTLVLIKPDALKNSLTGYILSQLSEFHTGLRFCGLKVVQVNKILASEHYAEHKGKVFYEPLLEYIMGIAHYPDNPEKRRVIAIVYQGVDAVKKIREIVGNTDPHKAREERPGSIRSLGTIVPIKNDKNEVIGSRIDNLIHASSSDTEAEREIKLWFKPNDIPPLLQPYPTCTVNNHYYYKNHQIMTNYEPGSICICAPGDQVWETDLQVLKAIVNNEKPIYSLESVVAKYLINDLQNFE